MADNEIRDRLIELIDDAEEECKHSKSCESCSGYGKGSLCIIYHIADRLIANGVTVQGWISVKDRLPKYTEEEMERYRFFGDTFFPEFNVMILGATKPTTLYFDGEKWYDEEGRCYYVTHWQPMPQLPKGE